MTLCEFNELDSLYQLNSLLLCTKIDTRQDGEFDITLYQMDDFYLEAFYIRDVGITCRLRTFTSVDELDIYLEKINLEGLF